MTKDNSVKTKKDLYYGFQMAIPLLFYVVALSSPMFLRLFIDTSNDSYLVTTTKLVILIVGILYLVPMVIGIPARDDGILNLVHIGFLKPKESVKSLLLGVLLGLMSLGAMLIGSILAGGYVFDPSTIDGKQIYFSLVPGIFEEVIFRGIIMVVLIHYYHSVKKAAAFQVFLFGIMHVKDISLWGFVDVLTVAIIGIVFTYVVYKTGHLMAVIVFHIIHDAFLFVVQKPGGVYIGAGENLAFYASVWIGMLIIAYTTKYITDFWFKHVDENEYITASKVDIL